MCVTRGSSKFVLNSFMPNTHAQRQTHTYACIKERDLPPMFFPEHYQHGELCMAEKSC